MRRPRSASACRPARATRANGPSSPPAEVSACPISAAFQNFSLKTRLSCFSRHCSNALRTMIVQVTNEKTTSTQSVAVTAGEEALNMEFIR